MILKVMPRKIKTSDISFKELSDEDKAAQLFYTLRFTKLLNFNIDELGDNNQLGL